ncbi:hypothetical protein [Corynebacterium aquilae]|uniref:LemA family protein n=1 Tax=Corynebacterium aquilae DSM 44791 TaxID=1431546 RepID=A0A1L7CGA5_9CORY|nr:hypothetical protein [Corynebacterium aquilae]APT84877.1 hypothetical protein CAQU_07110 [Corynebacterium aquilae DSM 44791]
MTTVPLILLVVLVAALVMLGTWAILTAQRLNRLNIRTDARLAALEAALNQRAQLIEALEPDHAELAREVQSIDLTKTSVLNRGLAERELSATCRRNANDTNPHLVAANTRVELAVRFYNEAVRDTRAVRLRPAVRFFLLGGTAEVPEFFEQLHASSSEQC